MEQETSHNLRDNSKAALALAYANYENVQLGKEVSRVDIGNSFYKLGKLYYDKSDLLTAREMFVYSLECVEPTQGKQGQEGFLTFKILGFLIRIASEQLDDKMAAQYIGMAEDLVNDMEDAQSIPSAEHFYNVGMVENYRGRLDQAKQSYQLALEKARQQGIDELVAKCLLALAVNCYNCEEYKDALNHLKELEKQLRITPKDYIAGSMYLYFAKTYVELGKIDRALEFFSIASSTLQAKKCWNLHGYILSGKGMAYKRVGEYDKALTFFKLALEATDKENFRSLFGLIENEIEDVNDSSVDLSLDRVNRKVHERTLGTINFKHRFVLLDVLFLLAQKPGEYFDKEQLVKHIWKGEYNPLIHDKLIYTSVSRLRKLIEPKGERGDTNKYIIRGKDGYTFNPRSKIRFHKEKPLCNYKAIANVDISSPV